MIVCARSMRCLLVYVEGVHGVHLLPSTWSACTYLHDLDEVLLDTAFEPRRSPSLMLSLSTPLPVSWVKKEGKQTSSRRPACRIQLFFFRV